LQARSADAVIDHGGVEGHLIPVKDGVAGEHRPFFQLLEPWPKPWLLLAQRARTVIPIVQHKGSFLPFSFRHLSQLRVEVWGTDACGSWQKRSRTSATIALRYGIVLALRPFCGKGRLGADRKR